METDMQATTKPDRPRLTYGDFERLTGAPIPPFVAGGDRGVRRVFLAVDLTRDDRDALGVPDQVDDMRAALHQIIIYAVRQARRELRLAEGATTEGETK